MKNENIYRFAPNKYSKLLESVMFYKTREEILRNSAIAFLAFVFSVIGFGILYYITGNILMILGLAVIPAGILIANYLTQYKKMRSRTIKVESHIPDMLHLIAVNIKSGMTPFRALKFSARDEFGPLKEEIDFATTKSFGTNSLSDAMLNMNKRVRSEMLDRVAKVFIS